MINAHPPINLSMDYLVHEQSNVCSYGRLIQGLKDLVMQLHLDGLDGVK